MLRPFPRYPLCPVCGDPERNPTTLGVCWWWNEEIQHVSGSFDPLPHHAGYAGCLHGGLLSALMDECLAWACAVEMTTYCVTGELIMRFKQPVPLGRTIELVGWSEVARGPYVRAAGEVRSPDGTVLATATGTFSTMPVEEAEALRQALDVAPGEIDVLTLK